MTEFEPITKNYDSLTAQGLTWFQVRAFLVLRYPDLFIKWLHQMEQERGINKPWANTLLDVEDHV